MDYLQRGGRISKSADPVGNQMKIHPVLRLLPDGVKPVDKVKGRKSCNAWLVNKLTDVKPDPAYTVVIGHSNAPERAEALKGQLQEAGVKNDLLITCIGPVVGTHIGPNCLGIGYVEA